MFSHVIYRGHQNQFLQFLYMLKSSTNNLLIVVINSLFGDSTLEKQHCGNRGTCVPTKELPEKKLATKSWAVTLGRITVFSVSSVLSPTTFSLRAFRAEMYSRLAQGKLGKTVECKIYL